MGGWRRRRCTQTRHGGRWALSRTHSFIHTLLSILSLIHIFICLYSLLFILSSAHTLICLYSAVYTLFHQYSFISLFFIHIYPPTHSLNRSSPPVSLWCGQPLLRHAGVCVCVCGALAATRARDALAALVGGWADPAHTHTDGCRRRAQAALVCTRGTGNGTENSCGVCTDFMTLKKKREKRKRKKGRGNW